MKLHQHVGLHRHSAEVWCDSFLTQWILFTLVKISTSQNLSIVEMSACWHKTQRRARLISMSSGSPLIDLIRTWLQLRFCKPAIMVGFPLLLACQALWYHSISYWSEAPGATYFSCWPEDLQAISTLEESRHRRRRKYPRLFHFMSIFLTHSLAVIQTWGASSHTALCTAVYSAWFYYYFFFSRYLPLGGMVHDMYTQIFLQYIFRDLRDE